MQVIKLWKPQFQNSQAWGEGGWRQLGEIKLHTKPHICRWLEADTQNVAQSWNEMPEKVSSKKCPQKVSSKKCPKKLSQESVISIWQNVSQKVVRSASQTSNTKDWVGLDLDLGKCPVERLQSDQITFIYCNPWPWDIISFGSTDVESVYFEWVMQYLHSDPGPHQEIHHIAVIAHFYVLP